MSSKYRDLASDFLEVEDEQEVTKIIHRLDSEEEIDWEPLGTENNYGVVENQSASSIGAMTEIITNSIDAILRKRYRERYSDEYNPKHDLNTYKEAAEDLLPKDHEETIEIVADGGRTPNITVLDSGEGQPPSKFKETFLSLLLAGQLKQSWPFLQGQFGMGSSAVLPHCGENGYKLILSAGFRNQETWTWTLVRKNRDGNTYQYLTINGDLPQFDGQVMERSYGTIVKHFNYKMKVQTHISSGFRRHLDRAIWDTPVPITIRDTRDPNVSGSSFGTVTTEGGFSRLAQYRQLIDHSYSISYDFGEPLGERKIKIIIFKDNPTIEGEGLSRRNKNKFVRGEKHRKRAIFFTVNGQRHGDQGLTFIKNRCDKYRVAKDTLVFIDFSDLGHADMIDLFMPSRDRLKDNPIADSLKDGLEDAIKNDQILHDEEQRRRQRIIKDKRDDQVKDMLKSVLKRNPSLKKYLSSGDKPSVPGTEVSGFDQFDPPFFPTEFNIIEKFHRKKPPEIWDEDERFEKRMPINREPLIRFKLDAPNDYFDREEAPGDLRITPDDVVKSWSLKLGVLTVKLKPLPYAEPGNTFPVTASVTRQGKEPLQQTFDVTYLEEVEEPDRDQEESSQKVEDETDVESLDLPDVNPIYEDEWSEVGFDEESIVEVNPYGDGDLEMEMNINMDAAPMKHFVTRHNLKTTGKEIVEDVWKAGITLYSLGQYIELSEEFKDDGVDPRSVVAVSMKGVAQSMLDQHISDDMLNEMTV